MNKIVIVDIIFRLLKHDSCEMRYNGKLINCSSMNSISRAQLPLFSHHNNHNLIFFIFNRKSTLHCKISI